MKHNDCNDVPLMSGTLTIRNPRRVLLLNPFQLPLVICLAIVSVVFTFWPEVLEHAPVGFEERGVVHHIWHYALLVGSLTTLVGMLVAMESRLKVELIGLILVVGTIGINFTAVVHEMVVAHTANTGGLGLALRAAFLVGLLVRVVIVLRQPTVPLPVNSQE